MRIPVELEEGYRRFRNDRYLDHARRFKELAKEQKPRTMVIACADSRVDPASIFAAAPGELYVARNVAALVPPYEETGTCHGTSAALEFAVEELKVTSIVVMGHGSCGGISAALAATEMRPVGRFIGPWVELLSEVRDRLIELSDACHPADRQKALERIAVQQSLHNLTTFPFVARAMAARRLQLHGAWFSIAEGELHWLDWDTGVFELIEARDPVRA
jgi:carbonic anhydrase